MAEQVNRDAMDRVAKRIREQSEKDGKPKTGEQSRREIQKILEKNDREKRETEGQVI